jgi:hypothetical protein
VLLPVDLTPFIFGDVLSDGPLLDNAIVVLGGAMALVSSYTSSHSLNLRRNKLTIFLQDLNDLVQSPFAIIVFEPEMQNLVTVFVPVYVGNLSSPQLLCVYLRMLDNSVGHVELNDKMMMDWTTVEEDGDRSAFLYCNCTDRQG